MQRSEIDISMVVKQVDCPGYQLELISNSNLLYVQVKVGCQNGRKWYLSPWMTDSEIVNTCLKAVITFAEHEIREQFRFKGHLIYGPHINVYKLIEVCNSLDTRD